ncbi:hypothetical protein [Deinococcus sp. SL84]|uniref:hypothetical protein n=1 Tax=Deinococcus sp. SL84 TaxID=2994663 RepID=UPI002275EBC2|nr:hypothetical protein [Deinococcus sp. SL84]MCY1703131.1 hypothetical protein [Deinococcus sp. SL84]
MARRSSSSKPRRARETVETPAGFLATHDLKERGWTARLIERHLGEHDSTRPNGLKMGGRRLPPVKLYREERVEQAEADEDFLIARMKAEDAREKRQAARERRERERALLLQGAAESYEPRVHRLDIRKGAVKKAREPYLPELERVLSHLAGELGGLKGGEEKTLRERLLYRLHLALAGVYEWYPHPDLKPQGRGAGAGKARAAARESSSEEAKPSDWRDWDWDEA